MRAILALIIFLLTFILSPNTVQAGTDYNSSISNSSSTLSVFIEQAGLGEEVVEEILKEFITSDDTILIEEGKLREKLISLGIDEERTRSILDELRRGATQEFLSTLPNPGLTPASPFYFLERWSEGIRD